MVSYGTAALVIYFCIVFAFWATPLVIDPAHSSEFGNYTDDAINRRPGLTLDTLLTSFLSPELLAGAGIIGASVLVFGGGFEIAIAAASIVFMANLVLTPISLLTSMGMPEPFNFFVLGILNLLLIVAIFSFIRGKDF